MTKSLRVLVAGVVLALPAVAAAAPTVGSPCGSHRFDRYEEMARYDVDKDGKLSDAERTNLKAGMKARRAEKKALLDTNKDGQLSEAERAAGRAKHQAKRFAEMDVDRSGGISQAEACGPVAKHFGQLDTDRNGQLSQAELTAGRSMMHKRGGHGRMR